MAEELKLFRSWSSLFGLRVVHALKIKGVDYETVFEDLKNKSALLLEYNPVHKKIPVLLHDGKPICESLVILEYIDEVWKQSPLLPQHPYDKAMARFWAKFGDEKVLPSIMGVFLSQGKAQEEAVGSFTENLKLLEEQLKGKKFFGGESIGYLDLALGWMANSISILEEITDLKLVDPEQFSSLSAWMGNFLDVPILKDCWPPRDEMVKKFKVLPSIMGVFLSQGKAQEEAVGSFTENLKLLEEQLKGKKFFGGESIGYLDLALGWMANSISILEEITDLKLVDPEQFSSLSAWMGNFLDVPILKDCWPPRDEMVKKFKVLRELRLK